MKYFGRQKFPAIPIQEFFLRRCGGKKLTAANVYLRQSFIQVTSHTNEKSLNDYDEGNERDHRRYRTSHISRTPQITTSNRFLGFSEWSFPTSAEQIQQASSHLAVAVNNFHNCQVTFSVIQGQRGSPKSSDEH